jgi:beta-glucosidase
MTLEEKAGSLTIANMFDDLGVMAYLIAPPQTIIQEQFHTEGATRGKLLPHEFAEYVNSIQAISEQTRLAIPFSFCSDPGNHLATDQLGAFVQKPGVSLWPNPIGLAATRDEALVQEFADIMRQEYRAMGILTALHPQVDLATEPRWGRIHHTFGEDATLSAELGVAYLRGLQGTTLGEESVLVVAKHFPGGGPQDDGLDSHFTYGKDQVYPGGNFDYHLIPFQAMIQAGLVSIMPYYGIPVDIPDEQTAENVGMGFSEYIITDLLKNDLGYEGVIMTDFGILWDEILGGLATGKPWGVEHLTETERVVKALNAGVDQFGGHDDPTPIIEAVLAGHITESRLDQSLVKILKNKFLLGAFEKPFVSVEGAMAVTNNQEFQARGDYAQKKSVVLLKNLASCLPMPGAQNLYLVNVDPAQAAQYGTVVANIANADYALIRVQAPYILDSEMNVFHEGTLAYAGAENEAELQSILQVVESKGPNTKVVVDMYMDRPAILSEFIDQVDAVTASFGTSDENLLAVLAGDFSPAGKLPFDLPSSMEEVMNQNEDVPFDMPNPLYHFGHGLTY